MEYATNLSSSLEEGGGGSRHRVGVMVMTWIWETAWPDYITKGFTA
jgi:hypothetical protein